MPTVAQKRAVLEGTAYHEAGHAIMAFELKRALRQVSVVPEKREDGGTQTLGHCLLTKGERTFCPDLGEPRKTRAWVEREVQITLAGVIAEGRFKGRRNHRGAHGDYLRALDCAELVHSEPKVLEKYVDYLWARTEARLFRPWVWRTVRLLAEALLEKRELSGKAARAIYLAHIRPTGEDFAELRRRDEEAQTQAKAYLESQAV